jgi:hypothetical protein
MTEPEIDPGSSLSKSHDPHKLPWYEPELTEVQPKAREILENYSNIPPDEVVQHVNKLVRGSVHQYGSQAVIY